MSESLDITKLSDRELLIVLVTKFDVLDKNVNDLKDGTNKELHELERKVGDLEAYKASKIDLEKSDSRLDRVRTTQNVMVGGLLVINALLPFIIKYLFE